MAKSWNSRIIQGNCLEILCKMEDNSVDMSFADPPFNIGKKYQSYHDNKEINEYLEWCKSWITGMVRVTKPTGSILIHNIPRWLTYYAGYLNSIADFKSWISWDAPTRPMGKSLQPAHYGILLYAKNAKKQLISELRYPHKRCRRCKYLLKDYGGKKSTVHPFGPLVSDVWTDIHRIKHASKRDKHPCQLPVHLLERIILLTTESEQIVLDPFLGTGTTAIAAKRLGRYFLGIEIDPEYVEISVNKVKQEKWGSSRIGESFVSLHGSDIVTIRNKDWEDLTDYFSIPYNPKDIDSNRIETWKPI